MNKFQQLLTNSFIRTSAKPAIHDLMSFQCQRCFRASSIMNSRSPNHYQILGLKSDSSEKDIKQAYFKLAKKYHPDLNPSGDTRDKFDKVSKAYEVLSDSMKKDAYDQQMGFGRSQFQDMHFSSQQARGRASGVYSDDEYQSMSRTDRRARPQGAGSDKWKSDPRAGQQFWEDVDNKETAGGKDDFAKKVWDEFDDFFDFKERRETEGAGSAGSKDETKGADYKVDVDIEFTEAFTGIKKKVEMNKRVMCQSCKGTRAKQGSLPRKCFECGGRGTVMGNYGIRKRCKKCNGGGCIVRQPCPECEGLGVQRGVIHEDIQLPSGVVDGQKLKIKGLGHASDVFHGIPGDLLINLKVKPHALFKREGLDIIGEIPISITEAVLGCKITIETLDGKLNIDVKQGTNSGDELRLHHHGMPPFHPPDNYDVNLLRGDHVVKFRVVIPQDLSEQQRDLMKQFYTLEKQNKHKFYSQQEQKLKNAAAQKEQQNDKGKVQQKQQQQTKQKPNSSSTSEKSDGGIFGSFKSIFK